MVMSAREVEAAMLSRCAAAARDSELVARDQKEANVFRLAAMVVRCDCPTASTGLMRASDKYFARHPDDRLAAVDVVRNGWVFSLPRLRDMLSRRLGGC